MRKFVVLVGVLVGAAFWAVPALADTSAPPDPATLGYIEICKAAGTGITSGTMFGFSVPAATSAAQQSISVAAGACSAPIEVAGTPGTDGTFTTSVTETSAPWFAISGISVTTNFNGATVTVPTSTTSYTVMGGDSLAAETRVTFTNQLVTGFIEVCKSPAPNSGLTSGEFTFRIQAGLNPVDQSFAFDQSVHVTLNECSSPIAVPAGNATVTETGGGVFITDVTASTNGGSTVSHPTVTHNGVTVPVAASTTAPPETMVTFFDALSALKICKVAGGTFTGTASFTVSGVSGVSNPVNIVAAAAPGNCVQLSQTVTPGSSITITEAPIVGSWVSSADLNGASLTTTANLATGTSVTFNAVNGANVVTFTDSPAPTVPVKVCKAGAPANSTVGLTIGGTATTLTVPSDGSAPCTQPVSYPFGTGLVITETSSSAGQVVTNMTASAGGTFSPVYAGGNTGTVFVGVTGAATQPLVIVTITDGAAGTAPVTPPTAPTPPSGAAAPSSGGSSGSSSGGSSGGSSSGSSSSSSSSTGGTSGSSSTGGTSSLTPTPSVVKTPTLVTLVTARFVQLKGNIATTKIKIVLVGRNHKVIGTVTRSVKTGKFIRVMKVGASVKSVKVSPLKI
jgi:hypothetical protein